jgi:beta-phosphoglucomutase
MPSRRQYVFFMSHWPAAILFDFDGVIVNSEPLHFYAFHEVLKEEKIELSEEEYYRELIGFDDRGAIKHLFKTRGLPLEPKTQLRLITLKSEAVKDLIRRRQYHALPGVEEFVRGLFWHYPLAICSGALKEEIEAMLEGVRLRDCFPTIVSAEDVAVGKPDPRGYVQATQLVSERLKITPPLKPADCLIIEDAPTVCRSVKAAGFPVLAVTTSYPAEQLAHADWVVHSLEPQVVSKKIPQLKIKV